MSKVLATAGAGFQFALPSCDAVIVHWPAPVMWTSVPVTEQLPLAENATGRIARLDEAVALTLKSASRNVLFGKASNVICWSALPIVKVRATAVAGFQFALPSWDAVIVHWPAPVMCTSVPVTVQLPLAENATGRIARLDEAVALTLKSASREDLFDKASNVICWSA